MTVRLDDLKKKYTQFHAQLNRHPVPFGLLPVVLAVIYEFLFRWWSGISVAPGSLLVPLCYCAAIGLIAGTIVELIPNEKGKRWLIGIFGLLATTIYLVEFYVLDAWHMFMTPAMIVQGAGGVMTDYTELVFSLLFRDSWRIVLMLALPGLAAWLLKPSRMTKRRVRGLASHVVCLALLGTVCLGFREGSMDLLKRNHNFEGAVRTLGFPVAVGQSVLSDIGGEEELSFVALPATYTPTVKPAQPTTPETTAPETTAPETTAPATTAPAATLAETTNVETTASEPTAAAAAIPETTAPETAAPATTAPETTAPETVAPETTAPETVAPETTAPETTAPETTAPETTATEATVPETTAPETTAPETVAPTEPVVYEPNILPLDYDAVAAGSYNAGPIIDYVLAQEPSLKNEYTGIFAGKNLILITAEAFTKEVIDPDRTPTLYRMQTQGINFTDYYQPAWGGSTTGGEMSNLLGLVPDCTGLMMQVSDQKPSITMGYQLQQQGYFSMAFHNNTGTFYSRDQTHKNLGYSQFISTDDGMDVGSGWPASDLNMMIDTIPRYIDHQPFSVYYMTVSGHSTYNEYNAMSKKNYDVVADLPYAESVKCYLAANQELEYAMAELISRLEEAGIADDTVIVLSTDHYPYGLDASLTWQNEKDCLNQLFGVKDVNDVVRDHSALLIWSGCLEGKNIVVDSPTFSLDILPTLYNLFGIPFESRMFVGRDVFSDKEPLVFWPNHSWVNQYGTYLSATDTFIPRGDTEGIDAGYFKWMYSNISNKINYCYAVQRNGFLRYLRKVMFE